MNPEDEKRLREAERKTLHYQFSQLRQAGLVIMSSFCKDFKINALMDWMEKMLRKIKKVK